MTKEDIIRDFEKVLPKMVSETINDIPEKVMVEQHNHRVDYLRKWLEKALDKHTEYIIREVMPEEVKSDYIFGDETPHEIYNSVIKEMKNKANKLGIKIN
jgi:hypothetical protein